MEVGEPLGSELEVRLCGHPDRAAAGQREKERSAIGQLGGKPIREWETVRDGHAAREERRFSDRMGRFGSSAVRDILKWTQGRDVISFAGGLPADELFPLEALREAFLAVFAQGGAALQYGVTEGYAPLREALSERLARKGIATGADRLLLTTGSQQVIDLTARVLLNEGDAVAVENPTYLAALQVFQSAGATVAAVERDDEGIDPVQLEAAIRQHRPKLLYAIPTFANPTGGVWSLERRLAILAICRRFEVLILEDDPYGDLVFEESAILPSLYALDAAEGGGNVIYTSTFSKTVVPALRTGWAAGGASVIRTMAKAKQAADLHSSTMDQQALYHLMLRFDLDAHIGVLRSAYRSRMERMAQALEREPIWRDARWSRPAGGMFLWLELPEGTDAGAMLRQAVEAGVAYVPGADFHPASPKRNTMRLNFSHSAPDRIDAGMLKLTAVYEAYKNGR